MTFVVPFDGSPHAKSALRRASEFGASLGESVVAITIIPNGNASYARQRGWLASDQSFDIDTIVSTVRTQVHDVAPDATVEFERCSRHATGNRIAKPIRKFAKRNGASMVFIGSENAGRIVTTLSSVGGRIATDNDYDLVIVRSD